LKDGELQAAFKKLLGGYLMVAALAFNAWRRVGERASV